ncbi:g6328 [Coccomyxa elongata]
MKGKRLVEFNFRGVTYRDGDCVLVRGVGERLPFVGKIKDVRVQGKNGQVNVQVAWFYRPEEATGGRKAFHGEKELFRSDHLDWCYASTIEGKCRVHSLQHYQALSKVTDEDFYTRFTYKPVSKEFRPDRVPVYCVCELPYNPDDFMILCSGCEEWYHPKCINLTKAHCEKLQHFNCPECEQALRASKRSRVDPSANGSQTGA